jgi:hypothetical protein
VNDKKCGYGIFTWASNNIYKGNYFVDLRHGYGEMVIKVGVMLVLERRLVLQGQLGERSSAW